MKKKSGKRFAASLAAALLAAVCLGSRRDRARRQTRENTLRLHVIGESQSREDTEIKMRVAEKLKAVCARLCRDKTGFDRAAQAVGENMELIEKTARQAVKEAGKNSACKCEIKRMYFPTCRRGDLTLPAGDYAALTVTVGEGEGKNVWCAFYPRQAAAACSKEEDEEAGTIFETRTVRVKLMSAQLRQEVKRFFSKDKTRRYDKL